MSGPPQPPQLSDKSHEILAASGAAPAEPDWYAEHELVADQLHAPGIEDELDMTVPTLVTLSEVSPERVRWLWPGRLPLGKLVVCDGDPSTGKSTLSLELTARVSTGRDWPDGAPGHGAADVLLLSAEDGLADTIAPRLIAAEADLARVHALLDVPLVAEDGTVRRVPPSLPRDIVRVERLVVAKGVRLVVVDVFMAYLAGVDAHKDQEVRGALHQLAAMAERTGCTVVLIRHLNKANGSNALYRGGGSIGIIGAARAAFIVARDPEDPHLRVLAVSKMNLGPEPPSLAYRLTDDPANGCAKVEWQAGTVPHTAASLLSAGTDEERSERNEAADWLAGFLSARGGSASRREVVAAAKDEGISERTLKRARGAAGVAFQRQGFAGGSVWSLEPSSPHSDHSGQPTEPGLNGLNGGPNGDGAAARRPLCQVCSDPLDDVLGSGVHPSCA